MNIIHDNSMNMLADEIIGRLRENETIINAFKSSNLKSIDDLESELHNLKKDILNAHSVLEIISTINIEKTLSHFVELFVIISKSVLSFCNSDHISIQTDDNNYFYGDISDLGFQDLFVYKNPGAIIFTCTARYAQDAYYEETSLQHGCITTVHTQTTEEERGELVNGVCCIKLSNGFYITTTMDAKELVTARKQCKIDAWSLYSRATDRRCILKKVLIELDSTQTNTALSEAVKYLNKIEGGEF